jgi:hypothetical protein
VKEKIAGISRGVIEYELPRIRLSKDRITASVEVGKRVSGRVIIGNDAEKSMKGLVCSDNRVVEPVTTQFVGVSNTVEYTIHAESIEACKTIDGSLTFITDCGEVELPYHIEVTAPTLSNTPPGNSCRATAMRSRPSRSWMTRSLLSTQ